MHYNTLFVSDIHLGTPQCKVESLLAFMKENTFNNIYMVGDIIDLEAMSRKFYWKPEHNKFVQRILKLSRKNTKIHYILGNHDHQLRGMFDDGIKEVMLGDIVISDCQVYTSLKNEKFLVTHGDYYDGAIKSMGWIYWLGDNAYEIALKFNTLYNKIRKLFGMEYWSISSYLKQKVKKVIQVMSDFDEIITRICLVQGYEGLIYGHVHSPSIKVIKTKKIINIGDHVENCTCVVEDMDGTFRLIITTNNKELASI
jgi:UDP-2,3-diacylglucosamine pyrophosphatase LpxH